MISILRLLRVKEQDTGESLNCEIKKNKGVQS